MHLIMAYGYYKFFHGVREQQYVSMRSLDPTPPDGRDRTGISVGWQHILEETISLRKRGIMANSWCFSELAREKMWSRLHILPLLQAEEDRDQARRFFADKARERELLGHETKVYNSDRYVFYDYFPTLGRGLILTGDIASSALLSSIPPPSSPSERDQFITVTVTVTATTRWRCCIFGGSRVSDVGRYMSFEQSDAGEENCTMGILPRSFRECLLDVVDIPSQLICFSRFIACFLHVQLSYNAS